MYYTCQVKAPFIDFEKVNKHIPTILLIGIALGVANYALGVWPNLGQSLIQQIVMSFVIGYPLVVISLNYQLWFNSDSSNFKQYGVLGLLYCLIGLIGTENQELVQKYFFQTGEYQPFNSQAGTYIFNVILSSILGISFIKMAPKEVAKEEDIEAINPTKEEAEPPLTAVPIRKGETTTLHPPQEIMYFEAYDNYSFLHDLHGNKHLCNYSLSFLAKRLPDNFLRVHRKFLINKEHIYQIKPHLKGRYVIVFKDKAQSSITSSASYGDLIKSLIRL